MKERTVTELSKLNGHVNVYLADEETGRRFLADAEREGFAFGDGEKPTNRHSSDLMIVRPDKTICYPGFIGRVAFGSGAKKECGERLIRVDYRKYVEGEKYLMRNS